ncbi:MAG: DNA-binding response regulator [Pleurocapsa sp.]
MLDKLFPAKQEKYKPLSIVIVESDREWEIRLTNAIKNKRPNYKILIVDNLEQIFSLLHGDIKIDLVFFDISTVIELNNITLLKAIEPEISLIHWSSCQHPEIIELLYSLGVNCFCVKGSLKAIAEVMDLAAYYPQSLYVDQMLYDCLPLLRS